MSLFDATRTVWRGEAGRHVMVVPPGCWVSGDAGRTKFLWRGRERFVEFVVDRADLVGPVLRAVPAVGDRSPRWADGLYGPGSGSAFHEGSWREVLEAVEDARLVGEWD
jgi:hypothetical protein